MTPNNDGYLTSKGHANYVLFLLFMLMLFDFMDRQVLAALLPYIKAEWLLSDTELGALVSAVNVAIAVLAFPTAVVIDRWSRTKAVGIMAIIWSLATAACAITTSFTQLLVARFVIGSGEAGYTPGGNTLLAALYPKRMRASVIGIFQSASMIGTVLGVVLGGIIATHWGWRAAFGVVALPGLIFSILIYFVRDYKTVRVQVDAQDGQAARDMHWHEMATKIFKTPLLLLLFLGNASQLFFVSTLGNWLPSFFNRVYGLPVNQAGVRTGLVIMMAALGMGFGGLIVDRMTGAQPRKRLLGPAAFSFMTASLFVTAFASAPGTLQHVLLFAGAFFMVGIIGPSQAAVQDVVHPGLRATSAGSMALFVNLFGMSLGPITAGILSDKFELQTALMIVAFAPLLAAVAFLAASFLYEKELAKVEKFDISMA